MIDAVRHLHRQRRREEARKALNAELDSLERDLVTLLLSPVGGDQEAYGRAMETIKRLRVSVDRKLRTI